MEKQPRFVVDQIGSVFKVRDTTTEKYITKDCPSKKIADEIADDFNRMENKDFRPIGMPDFSKCKN